MWFNADDRLMHSPEVLAIPRRYRAAAMGVWLLCGTYCSGQLTDGFVPDAIIKDAGGTAELRGWLVRVGLWEEADGGITYTPRGCRVPRTDVVQKERASGAQRSRDYRARKRNEADQQEEESVTPLRDRDATECVTPNDGIGIGIGLVSNQLSDSQPSEAVTKSGTSPARRAKSPPGSRGSRLPEGWQPPDDVIRAMHAELPMLDLRAAHLKFTDHFAGASGQRGVRCDWPATWRNWMRTANERGESQATTKNGHRLSRADEKSLAWLAMGQQAEEQPRELTQ